MDDTKPPNFKFEGQAARSKKWFVLDDDWLKTNFVRRDRYLYEDLYSPDVFGKKEKRKIFSVPIGNTKFSYINALNPYAP